jgi:hypothetical protein
MGWRLVLLLAPLKLVFKNCLTSIMVLSSLG